MYFFIVIYRYVLYRYTLYMLFVYWMNFKFHISASNNIRFSNITYPEVVSHFNEINTSISLFGIFYYGLWKSSQHCWQMLDGSPHPGGTRWLYYFPTNLRYDIRWAGFGHCWFLGKFYDNGLQWDSLVRFSVFWISYGPCKSSHSHWQFLVAIATSNGTWQAGLSMRWHTFGQDWILFSFWGNFILSVANHPKIGDSYYS